MAALLVHSDIRGFNSLNSLETLSSGEMKLKFLDNAFADLRVLSSGREILLPAFNYDFTSTRRFDVELDLPQVGSVPKAAMTRQGWYRSVTPVYSFISNQTRPKDFPKPFSEESIFSELVKKDGEILLVGVGFESLTFIHHVEHVFGVPYRYEKQFVGSVIIGGRENLVGVHFHVRPMGLGLDYDFNKIGRYLIDSSAARIASPKQIFVSPKMTMECLKVAMKRDPNFLLTRESEKLVSDKLNLLGRSFKLEDFE